MSRSDRKKHGKESKVKVALEQAVKARRGD
jgi:hypothetical protein